MFKLSPQNYGVQGSDHFTEISRSFARVSHGRPRQRGKQNSLPRLAPKTPVLQGELLIVAAN
jgi:hypothetical protein